MVIILRSGLSQAGTAWLRVALLNDPREYFRLRQNGWVGGRTDSLFTDPLEKTKQERSVLSQHSIYSPSIPSCACKCLHAVICAAQKKPISTRKYAKIQQRKPRGFPLFPDQVFTTWESIAIQSNIWLAEPLNSHWTFCQIERLISWISQWKGHRKGAVRQSILPQSQNHIFIGVRGCTSSSLVTSELNDRLTVNQRIHLCVTLLYYMSTPPQTRSRKHPDGSGGKLLPLIPIQKHPWPPRLECDTHPAMVVGSRLSQVSRKSPVGNLLPNGTT